MEEKKDSATLEAFLSLVLLLFLRCNPRFPFAHKWGSRAPMKGDPDRHEIKTQKHDTNTQLRGDRTLNTRSLRPSETWDHFPLSLVYNPTTNFQC